MEQHQEPQQHQEEDQQHQEQQQQYYEEYQQQQHAQPKTTATRPPNIMFPPTNTFHQQPSSASPSPVTFQQQAVSPQNIRAQFQTSEESRLFLQIVESINLGERVEEAILPLILANDLANVTLWKGSEIVISEWIESLKHTQKVSIGSYMALKRTQETLLSTDFANFVPVPTPLKIEKASWNCEFCSRVFKLGRSGQITKPIQNHQSVCAVKKD